MANGNVPPVVIRGLTAALAVTAVLGFAALSIYAFVKTLQASKFAPSLNDSYLYVTAGLSSLVGGVVAVAFGQKPPAESRTETLSRENIKSLTRTVTGRHPEGIQVGSVIGTTYAITYFLFGLIAIVLWIIKQDLVADPVKALAATVLGMLIPIVRGYFD